MIYSFESRAYGIQEAIGSSPDGFLSFGISTRLVPLSLHEEEAFS